MEAQTSGVEERPGFPQRANVRATLNPTRSFVLAQAHPGRAGLLKCSEGVDNVNAWPVYGKAVNDGSKAIHAGLRDVDPS